MRPFIISITGAHSGCGKTYIAETLISSIPINWGAIKYTKTALYSSLINGDPAIEEKGKDTWRLRRSGAKRVIWIQSPRETLNDLLLTAVTKLGDVEGIIIEGNSPAELIQPDIVIFVFGEDSGRIKPSATSILKKAEYILYKEKPSIKTNAKLYNKYSAAGIKEMIHDILKRRKM